jgi:phenylacetate-CoA ligase
VVIDKDADVDRITLKIELLPGRESDRPSIEGQLIDELRLETNLRYDLEFHDYGALPRYEVKARRFKDLRGTH